MSKFLTATNEHQVEQKSIENSVLIIYESCIFKNVTLTAKDRRVIMITCDILPVHTENGLTFSMHV